MIEELANDVWRITRLCCKTRGLLIRPANSVVIPHLPTCPYYVPPKEKRR